MKGGPSWQKTGVVRNPWRPVLSHPLGVFGSAVKLSRRLEGLEVTSHRGLLRVQVCEGSKHDSGGGAALAPEEFQLAVIGGLAGIAIVLAGRRRVRVVLSDCAAHA